MKIQNRIEEEGWIDVTGIVDPEMVERMNGIDFQEQPEESEMEEEFLSDVDFVDLDDEDAFDDDPFDDFIEDYRRRNHHRWEKRDRKNSRYDPPRWDPDQRGWSWRP